MLLTLLQTAGAVIAGVGIIWLNYQLNREKYEIRQETKTRNRR